MIDALAKKIAALGADEQITILTGAGVSAESGIPTFRDALTGLWAQYDPEELATADAFRADPKLVWDWYQWRRDLIANCQPNPGHTAIAQLARIASCTLVTQNVDGLHQQAGSQNVIELHGNITRCKCFNNGHLHDGWDSAQTPPRCPLCNSYLRPDVVWFGESLSRQHLDAAVSASENCHIFLAIGTSALVHPAAVLPLIAADAGAFLVEINPSLTPLTQYADLHIKQPSGEVLPQLINAI